MAIADTRSSARSGNIVNLAADSADALHTTDDAGRNAVLALGYARDVGNASNQLISQIVRP